MSLLQCYKVQCVVCATKVEPLSLQQKLAFIWHNKIVLLLLLLLGLLLVALNCYTESRV